MTSGPQAAGVARKGEFPERSGFFVERLHLGGKYTHDAVGAPLE